MKKNFEEILSQVKIVIFIYIIICLCQMVALKTPVKDLFFASCMSFSIVVIAITAKNLIKKPNLPGFAWATLISFALTLPISPVSGFIVSTVEQLNFTVTITPLLAFAGISVGNQISVLKELSWKLVLISFIVMTSTYFGSALISQLVLKSKGMI